MNSDPSIGWLLAAGDGVQCRYQAGDGGDGGVPCLVSAALINDVRVLRGLSISASISHTSAAISRLIKILGAQLRGRGEARET